MDKKIPEKAEFRPDNLAPNMVQHIKNAMDFLLEAATLVGSNNPKEVATAIHSFISTAGGNEIKMGAQTYTVGFIRISLAMSLKGKITVLAHDDAGRISKVSVDTTVLKELGV